MWQIVGLILDIAGAILLYISTEKMNKIILNLLSFITSFIGKHGGAPKNAIISQIQKDKPKATRFALYGLILLVLGFICQLVTALQQYK